MNEASMQNILFRNLDVKHHILITPSVKVFRYFWESDLVSVTNSDMVYEYEIKLSRADFLQDFKKYKHGCIIGREINIPNYFYYVVDSHILKLKDLPNYAGLMYVKERVINVIKKAPKLHSNKISMKVRKYLERGIMYRYWRERDIFEE